MKNIAIGFFLGLLVMYITIYNLPVKKRFKYKQTLSNSEFDVMLSYKGDSVLYLFIDCKEKKRNSRWGGNYTPN